MLANILLVLGIVFLSGGVYLKFRSAPAADAAPVATATVVPTANAGRTESEVKGTDFEMWVADKFRSDLFEMRHWSGDKRTANGRSATSDQEPDMQWDLKLGNKRYPFAVECKWRTDFIQGRLDMAKTYQVKNYLRYAMDEDIPVFIVLGVGGKPSAPKDLYIVPIEKATEGVLSFAELQPYRQPMKRLSFYYDVFSKSLSY